MVYKRILNEWLDKNSVSCYYDRVAEYVQTQLTNQSYSLYYINDFRWLAKFLPEDDSSLIVVLHPCEYDRAVKGIEVIPFDTAATRRPIGIEFLLALVDVYKDKTFLILQSSPDVYTGHDRLHLINCGSNIVIQEQLYPQVKSIDQKQFTANYHACFLSLQPKNHRVIAASYLIGLGLLDSMLIRGSNLEWQNLSNWWQVAGYTTEPSRPESRIIQQGYDKYLIAWHGGQPDGYVFPPERSGDNVWNFETKLRPIYQNTLVEIVPETTFVPQYRSITEKYLHTVYAKNLPIWISARHTVAEVRSLGFDVFDDYINHSYDLILDPLERILRAINDNLKLLQDREYAKTIWQDCQIRMDKNIDHARQNLYNRSMSRFKSEFDNFLIRRKNAESIV